MIPYIKGGYNICVLTAKNITKKYDFSELNSVSPKIKEEISQMIENKGAVFAIRKKKILKAVYIFNGEEVQQKRNLAFLKSYNTTDVEERIAEFNEALIDSLKQEVALEVYGRINWDDKEIIPKQILFGKTYISTIAVWILIGMLFGIIIDDLFFGFLIGMLLGACLGAIVVKK